LEGLEAAFETTRGASLYHSEAGCRSFLRLGGGKEKIDHHEKNIYIAVHLL